MTTPASSWKRPKKTSADEAARLEALKENLLPRLEELLSALGADLKPRGPGAGHDLPDTRRFPTGDVAAGGALPAGDPGRLLPGARLLGRGPGPLRCWPLPGPGGDLQRAGRGARLRQRLPRSGRRQRP